MELLPILLGGDLNCYGMALAFYEAGCPRSVALGKYRLGVTSFSRLVRPLADRRMENDAGRLAMIGQIASAYPSVRPILIGCTDEYASFLIREASVFDERYVVPSPPPRALKYADKAVFFEICKRYVIGTPKTVVLREGEGIPADLPFAYPIVLKPALSEEYWRHPFAGMRKVWFPEDREGAVRILRKIRDAGYCNAVILQEKLRIEDCDNYVLTTYSDRLGRVTAVAYGRVLLEEHTPRGLGNHAAILTEKMPAECKKLLSFLENIGYRGFANFDLVRDPVSGELYTLEMNLRQGRSNHYMTAAGVNPAALVIDDRILCRKLELAEASPDIFWHSVPLEVIYSQLKDIELIRRLRALSGVGRAVSPFHVGADLKNPMHRLYVMEHERRVRKRRKALAAE